MSPGRFLLLFTAWCIFTGALSYGVFVYRTDLQHEYVQKKQDLKQVRTGIDTATQKLETKVEETAKSIFNYAIGVKAGINESVHSATAYGEEKIYNVKRFIASFLDVPEKKKTVISYQPIIRDGFIPASYSISPPPMPTLSEMKMRKQEEEQAKLFNAVMPAAAPLWEPEQPELNVEAVLVPRQITVISSAQDGRIAKIPFNHGDRFKKGDVLVAYDCSNIRAEADIAKVEKIYTGKRMQGTDQLFKLDIISDMDRAGALIEDQKATIKDKLYQARLQDCDIRAEFDGRVTNRLANPGEYTRTDRVLMEVASNETLQVEFLVPSKWLRWVNIGAPISITVSETEKKYTAKITRIHGEVDPVSQSIQMVAALDSYDDPLLPGMSGKAIINVNDIRNAGVQGYLEIGLPPEAR